jgi:hypothetical protein
VVELDVWQGYRQIVWPALWPATFMIGLLAATRHALPVFSGGLSSPATVAIVLLHMAIGGALYAGVFFMFGIDRQERKWFSSALTQVWRRSLATA